MRNREATYWSLWERDWAGVLQDRALGVSLCRYCRCLVRPPGGLDADGAPWSIDHLIPVSRGGGNEWDNLAIVCRSCNSTKNDLTDGEYRAVLLLRELAVEASAGPVATDRIIRVLEGVAVSAVPTKWDEWRKLARALRAAA